MIDLEGLSEALAARVDAAAAMLAGVRASADGRALSGIVWQAGVVVTSEQALPAADSYHVALPGGAFAKAALAGRDTGTNVAVLRVEGQPAAAAPADAPIPRPGALAIAVGDGPAARLALVAEAGPAWHSMAGGKIDAKLRLDMRATRAEEGGPVLDAAGRLIGMATAGPRGQALVIPFATIARAVEPLLAHGRVRRGWLGLGLQPVAVPQALAAEAGQPAGLMIASLAAGGPGEQAGCLPGDILLALDGASVMRPRALRAALGPDRVGAQLSLRLIRAGRIQTLAAVVAVRPDE
jgi:S1-C subfamily serine protease